MQHSQTHVDHLEVLAAGGRGEQLWARPDVVDDGVLEPWDSGEEGGVVSNVL